MERRLCAMSFRFNLCRFGIHRPLRNHVAYFTDKVSGKIVYSATCSCGKVWMTDSPFGFWGFRIKKKGGER